MEEQDSEFFTVIVHEGENAVAGDLGVTFQFDDFDEVIEFLALCFDNPRTYGKYVEIVQNYTHGKSTPRKEEE